MSYTKNTWVDQDVERPKTYEVTNNQDGSITLTDSFGLVTELGTPVNAANMNHIEDGIEDLDLLKANIDLSNLSNAGEKHFLNKSQISNCILEAPNGVLTYSGNTITLKAGLKVLVPDGRNSDGTLKSIEVTLQNDVTDTLVGGVANRPRQPIFIDSEGNIYKSVRDDGYFITNGFPSQTWTVVYSPKTNITKCTVGEESTDYQTVKYAFIGYISTDSNLNVTSATLEQPVRIYTNTDNQYLSSMGMPGDKYIDLTLGASGSTYTAPANGYYRCYIGGPSGDKWLRLNTTGDYTQEAGFTTKNNICFTVPIQKGQILNVKYSGNVTVRGLRFIYAEGEA